MFVIIGIYFSDAISYRLVINRNRGSVVNVMSLRCG